MGKSTHYFRPSGLLLKKHQIRMRSLNLLANKDLIFNFTLLLMPVKSKGRTKVRRNHLRLSSHPIKHRGIKPSPPRSTTPEPPSPKVAVVPEPAEAVITVEELIPPLER